MLNPGLVSVKGGDCARVGWTLSDDHIAWVNEDFANQVEALLATSSHQDIVWINFDPLMAHNFDCAQTSIREAFSRPVLKSVSEILGS
jgi:hypothetical protein